MSIEEADWAWLPGIIMDAVLKKLGTIEQYLRVSRVCKLWYYFVRDYKEFNELLCNQIPLLVIPGTNNRRDRRNLYNVIDGKIYDVQLSVPYNRRCCGSSHGWLATVGRKMVISLINPFSQRRIRLPPIYNIPNDNVTKDFCFYLWVHKVVLSKDPNLSPENCVVGAIYGEYCRLAFIKLGDENWTYVDANLTLFTDMTFSNGLLHAIDNTGKIISIDISIDSYVGENEIEVIVPSRMQRQLHMTYVVESCRGDILMVRRFVVEQPEHEDLYLTREIRVFKLRRNSSMHSGWIEIKNLNGKTLFIGDNHSTSVSSAEIPGLKPNCIYYTDDCYDDGLHHYRKNGPVDLGVFNMDNGCFEAHYILNPAQKQFPPAIFITPKGEFLK